LALFFLVLQASAHAIDTYNKIKTDQVRKDLSKARTNINKTPTGIIHL